MSKVFGSMYDFSKAIPRIEDVVRDPLRDLAKSMKDITSGNALDRILESIDAIADANSPILASPLFLKQFQSERLIYENLLEPYQNALQGLWGCRHGTILEQLQSVVHYIPEDMGYWEVHESTWEKIAHSLGEQFPGLGIGMLSEEAQGQYILSLINFESTDDLDSVQLAQAKDLASLCSLSLDVLPHEAMSFLNYLSKYPMLGLAHPVGQSIYDHCAKRPVQSVSGIELVRVRPWEDKQQIHYVEEQMFQPPFGVPEQGRYNPCGVSTLYFAEDIATATAEIGQHDPSRATFMKATLSRAVEVFEIPEKGSPIFSLCNKPVSRSSRLVTEYLVPNFFAQCCKCQRIDGIAYPSAAMPGKRNYAFFGIHEDSFDSIELLLE